MTGDESALALERCVGDPGRFLREHWGRWPLHHRSDGHGRDAGHTGLLSFEDVDLILATMSLRLPAFRLVKDGATLPSSGYTRSGRTGSQPVTGMADAPRIFELFRQGATIVLQGMHRYWPPLARFCRALEMTLGHPTQVNAYITPPGSRGLAVHRDSHDVLVLQTFGRKHWEVWAPEMPVDEARGGADPVLSVELRPGECLYMPVNTPHAALAQEVVSGHLTIGILTASWAELLRSVLKRIETEPAFAERLPAGHHRDPDALALGAADRIGRLRGRLDELDPKEIAAERIRSFLTTRPSLVDGTLPGLLELDAVTDRTVVGRRPSSVCELMPTGDRLLVLLGDRELRMPAPLEGAMRFIAGHQRFRVADLGDHLDTESRLVLVRRLIREGLLEAHG